MHSSDWETAVAAAEGSIAAVVVAADTVELGAEETWHCEAFLLQLPPRFVQLAEVQHS